MDTPADTNVAADELRSFVERIERLEEDKKAIGNDIKDVYAEAKVRGFNTKVLRRIISLRKLDPHERAELEAIEDLYKQALGMDAQLDLPFDNQPDPEPEPTRRRRKASANEGVPA